MTRRILTGLVIAAAFALPALAASVSTPVTPKNIGTHLVGFTITTAPQGKDTRFEITVTRKDSFDPLRFAKPMGGELVRVEQTPNSFGFTGVRNVKKESLGDNKIRFRFTATPTEVKHLSFEIGFPNYAMFDGKLQWMPSANFYYLHLRDFARR
ncbi:MAG: hypothetical protein QM758_01305 [Armatimonas sp.]